MPPLGYVASTYQTINLDLSSDRVKELEAHVESVATIEISSIAQQLPPVPQGCTRLYLCRHGQTEFNRLHKYQGRGVDCVLNSNGLDQAACLAHSMRNIPLRAIYSSSLRRARETAVIVAKFHPQVQLQSCKDIEEMSFGLLEGQDHSIYQDQVHAIHTQWCHGDFSVRFPAGESPLDVVKRGFAKIDSIMKASEEQDHVLIVTHGRFNKVILAQMLYGGLEKMHEVTQDNTCVNVVDFEHATGTYSAVVLNNLSHLQSSCVV